MQAQDLKKSNRIQYNYLARGIIAFAAALSVILALSIGIDAVAVIATLMGASVMIRIYTQIRNPVKDVKLTRMESAEIIKWTLIGLLIIEAGNLVYPNLYQPPIPQEVIALSVTIPSIILVFHFVLITVEEVFFRGEFLDIFLSIPGATAVQQVTSGFGMKPSKARMASIRNVFRLVGPPLAVLLSAVIFTVPYHLFVYGNSGLKLAFVFTGGIGIGVAVVRSKQWLTGFNIHLINNLFSFGYGEYVLLVIVVVVMLFLYKKRIISLAKKAGAVGKW